MVRQHHYMDWNESIMRTTSRTRCFWTFVITGLNAGHTTAVPYKFSSPKHIQCRFSWHTGSCFSSHVPLQVTRSEHPFRRFVISWRGGIKVILCAWTAWNHQKPWITHPSFLSTVLDTWTVLQNFWEPCSNNNKLTKHILQPPHLPCYII